MRRIDELHLEHPFAGARMLARLLRREGIQVGRQHVGTLMKRMGIEALYRRPNTSRKNAAHKIWPYLLRDRKIDRANQVWALDTTYIFRIPVRTSEATSENLRACPRLSARRLSTRPHASPVML
ncbi:HTH-like domain protein [compost metagenome]